MKRRKLTLWQLAWAVTESKGFILFFTWATNTTFKVFPRYSFTLEFYLPIRKDFTYELTDREVRHQNSAKTKQFNSIICKGSDQTDEKGTRLVAKAPL